MRTMNLAGRLGGLPRRGGDDWRLAARRVLFDRNDVRAAVRSGHRSPGR